MTSYKEVSKSEFNSIIKDKESYNSKTICEFVTIYNYVVNGVSYSLSVGNITGINNYFKGE